MMRVVFAVTGLAASLLLACAAQTRDMATPPASSGGVAVPVQPSTHQDHSMTSASQGGELLPGARDVAQRLLTFLSEAQFTTDLAQENVEKHMEVTLGPDPSNGEGWTVYRSPTLGQGWNYGVQQVPARPPLKAGFSFWFEHADRTVSASPVCALPLDKLRSTLTSHGWTERTVPSEIGSVLAIEFAKRELVVTLTPRDIAFSGDTKCVLALQISGGH